MQNMTHVYEIEKKDTLSRLEKEILYRKSVEDKLRIKKKVLGRILDSVDEAVLAVNEFSDIIFLNHLFEKISGYKRYELTGTPVGNLIQSDDHSRLSRFITRSSESTLLNSDSLNLKNVRIHSRSGRAVNIDINVTPVEIENQHLFILKLKNNSCEPEKKKMVKRAEKIAEAVHVNRGKLKVLKKSITGIDKKKSDVEIFEKFEELCTSFEALNRFYLEDEDISQRRVVAVRLMNHVIAYWKLSTGKSKADLAVQSTLWKMYITGDGFQRTQTLDKYFNINTLPGNPRWQKIIATAEFVLNASNMKIEERAILESYLEEFRLLI